MNNHINHIVIVGGGTAGWMAASALSALLPSPDYRITLIESDQIGTVGVGEATIPPIRAFNDHVGIDEKTFMKKTGGTFKLGIQFHNWKKRGEHYFHPFGNYGRSIGNVPFHQYWLKAQKEGSQVPLADYSLCDVMSRSKKFAPANMNPKSPLSSTNYAYHLDAGLYAKFLRERSEKKGVIRHEGKIINVNLRESDGFIDSVLLDNQKTITGDFFIDCSGFRGILIEDALKTGYEDWSDYLPCDRALAVPSESVGGTKPYTMSIAHQAGWQWRIPLQHRTGNGHVYCSRYISDDEAANTLLSNLEGKALGDPRPLKFMTGRRKKFWNKNCLAIGLSAGFMEPLESTSIHLIQESIAQLLNMLPGGEFNTHEIDQFNNVTGRDYELIRDFLILHYHLNERDEKFWVDCQTMPIPDSLKHRIALFRNRGRLFIEDDNLFRLDSWLAVLHGQGIMPEAYDPMVETKDEAKINKSLLDIHTSFIKTTNTLPTHDQYIKQHCRANF